MMMTTTIATIIIRRRRFRVVGSVGSALYEDCPVWGPLLMIFIRFDCSYGYLVPCRHYVVLCVSVPSKVKNVRITSFGSDHISLSWDVPDASIEAYEVQSWKDSDRPVNATATVVNSPNITFCHMMQQSRYSFLVIMEIVISQLQLELLDIHSLSYL